MNNSDDQRTSIRTVATVMLLIFSIALGLRLAYQDHTQAKPPMLRGDSTAYFFYAYNIARHDVFSRQGETDSPVPDAYRSPGYPLVLSLAMMGLGMEGFWDHYGTMQAWIGALAAVLTVLLGRLFLPGWAAATAGILVALSPHLVAMSSVLLTETLYGTVLIGALFFFFRSIGSSSPILWIATGTFFGFGYLVNQTLLPIPVVILVAVAMVRRRCSVGQWLGASRRDLILFLAVYLVFPIGWQIRNWTVVPDAAATGFERLVGTMATGAYPGFVHKDPNLKYYPYKEDPQYEQFSHSLGAFIKEYRGRIAERPGTYLRWYLAEKPYHQWGWDVLESRRGIVALPGEGDVYIYPVSASWYQISSGAKWLHRVMRWLHPVVVGFALVGIGLSVAGRAGIPAALAGLLLYYTVLGMVLAPWPRYVIPLRPELYLLAIWAVVRLGQMGWSHPLMSRIRGRRQPDGVSS